MSQKRENPLKGETNNLEWGNHNSELSDENFIDRRPKKISDQNELLSGSNAPINVSSEEQGRNRKGVKEGENPLDSEDRRGKVF